MKSRIKMKGQEVLAKGPFPWDRQTLACGMSLLKNLEIVSKSQKSLIIRLAFQVSDSHDIS